MVLDSNGYLGIGINTPFSKLTLSGGNLTVLREDAADAIVEPMNYSNTGTNAPAIQFMRAR